MERLLNLILGNVQIPGHFTRPSFVPAVLALAVLCLAGAGCKTGEGPTVESLEFQGNQAFDDAVLKDVVVTQASGRFPWSRKYGFDEDEFDQDLNRLRAFYRDRGYPNAQVSVGDITFNEDNTAVSLRIDVDEGEPLIVEEVAIDAPPGLPESVTSGLKSLPVQEGQPLDRAQLAATQERALFLLRDSGYPDAHVAIAEHPVEGENRTRVSVEVEPGPVASFGEIQVEGLDEVNRNVVVRSLTFVPGDLYRQSEVLESQRKLNALGLFTFAHVGQASQAAGGGDGGSAGNGDGSGDGSASQPNGLVRRVPIVVTVAEAKTTRLQAGIGYGSEDGPRGSIEWRNLNFLRDARQLTANAQYSRRLSGVETAFTEPFFLTRHLSATLDGYSWWADEPTYSSRTYGGGGSIVYRWTVPRGLRIAPIEHTARVRYRNESLRYSIPPDVLADLTRLDELIALGFDPVTGSGTGRLAAIEVSADRVQLDQPLDPSQGYTLSARLQTAAPALGGTFDFRELSAEARGFAPLGRMVLAGRFRTSAIYAADEMQVPFSQRYFLGGSSSLRGWGRFEVAPLTEDGLPIGGLALMELSSELRFPIHGAIGGVVFVDAGNVWRRPGDISVTDLRASAGGGVRYSSPVGIVRADLGYQLNPIAGLIVNGEPQRRRWRIHFSIGHAF